jgi:hypothetical protein
MHVFYLTVASSMSPTSCAARFATGGKFLHWLPRHHHHADVAWRRGHGALSVAHGVGPTKAIEFEAVAKRSSRLRTRDCSATTPPNRRFSESLEQQTATFSAQRDRLGDNRSLFDIMAERGPVPTLNCVMCSVSTASLSTSQPRSYGGEAIEVRRASTPPGRVSAAAGATNGTRQFGY